MTNKYQEQWMDTAPGRATDPDGVAGFQCVDTVKDYFMAIFGLAWEKGWPGAGNAKDMLYTFGAEYFDRILNDPNDPNLIPQRGDIIVYGGTAETGPNPYGHIAVVLSATTDNVTVIQQDGFLQCPMYVGTLPYYLPTAGSVTGWLRPKFDDDPSITVQTQGDVVLAPNQRRAGASAVNERAEASTSSAIVRLIPAGSLETWDGFVHGETVDLGNGNVSDLWLKDAQGYASALLFDPTNVDGLPDLTPKADPPVLGNERVTGSSGAIRRAAPDKSSTALETFMPDRILTFSGFVHGTDPYGDGNNVWFVGITGGYFWAGAFLDMGTHDLRDLTPATPAATTPAEVYDFELDVLEVNGIKVEKVPADITNLQRGNFVALADLKDFICHWWDDPAKKPVIEGVISEFHRSGSLKSVQFVVNDKRVVQMVKIGDRAYHATASNGNMIGIEIDPRAWNPADPAFEAIWDNVRALRAAIEAKLGHAMTPHLHKDTPGNIGKTSCSGLDLKNLEAPAPAPAPAPASTPAPAPEPAPAPAPEPSPATSVTDPGEVLMRFFRWLVDLFLVSQKK